MPTKACDICGTVVDTIHLVSHPPLVFQDTVAAGFTPDKTTLTKLASSTGGSSAIALLVWRHGLVPASDTDWSLCNHCCDRAEPYRDKAKRAKGHTVDEAKHAAAALLNSIDGASCVIFDIISDVRTESVQGKGTTSSEAADDAMRRITKEAFDITEPHVVAGGRQCTLTREAQSEDDARQSWNEFLSEGVRLDALTCLSMPKAGILGIGRKPGVWSIAYTTPIEVELHYKLPAEVRAVTMPVGPSVLSQLRQYESRLTDELTSIKTRAEEDRRRLEHESRRDDFLVKMMTQSLQSGLGPKETFAVAPMKWPEYVNRELDRLRQQISACSNQVM